MYLDIDGVLFPYELIEEPSHYDNGTPELYMKSREYCNPVIVNALAALAIEIVLASSRQEAFLHEFTYLTDVLGIKRALSIDEVYPANIFFKRNAIIKDQERQPRPFVWVDDHISWLNGEGIQDLNDSHDALFVAPDRMTGLTLGQIETIGEFISLHKT
jgi:hypothetical protein